jgi:hypothetical protein
MKQTFKIIIISIIVLALAYFANSIYNKPKFDTKPYEAKIDSLQKGIDSLVVQNDSLETDIKLVEDKNAVLSNQSLNLKGQIKELKSDYSHIERVKSYTPTQLDSFFIVRYADQYKQDTKDTIHLPIPVAKYTVIDLLELDKTSKILSYTDSLVTVLDKTIAGKDTVISLLRGKEVNYQGIIKNQISQGENYKIQIAGLKDNIKKDAWALKKAKITNFILGTAVIGLFVTHK